MATLERSPADRVTVALTVVFSLSLLVVSRSGDPRLWIGWSVLMVVLSGAALIRFNRPTHRP
ncbi:hypothetical protein [Natronobiforma cellulositropha]|uniref:hypothetical protein n=1 Tax=Natronobiforma cellulositropha TaxID=1679076 RepID=UPI0021D5C7E3|nr:hypothetical protein [Natronobiforma cellulositropha]